MVQADRDERVVIKDWKLTVRVQLTPRLMRLSVLDENFNLVGKPVEFDVTGYGKPDGMSLVMALFRRIWTRYSKPISRWRKCRACVCRSITAIR